MKKKWFNDEGNRSLFKWLRVMKLTTFFILAALIQVSASVYSQQTKLSISLQNASVKEVLKQIEDQSDFFFLYKNENIDVNRVVSVDIKEKSVEYLLDQVFKGTTVSYEVVNRQIVLVDKQKGNFNLPSQQQKFISGKVTDSTGGSLPGVSVVVKGTTSGVITDSDGKYSLAKVPENATLQFSFVGMKTQEISVSGKTSINITLVEEAIGIDEVVAIGYGTVKKSDLTGSVSQVQSDAINAYPSTNVLQALSGKSAGVQVMQNTGAPGASTSIRIRGSNSIQGSNEPLYVVDGFPISNITAFNNSDIESIEILKDASSTAIYGSRGANGVVLITTKQGKEGRNTIDFESSYSSQSLIRKLDLMNAKEYATFYNEQATNDGIKPYFTESQISDFGNGYDWQNLVFQSAPVLTTSLNVNGGNEKTKFSISGSMLNQNGIIEGSDYDRYSIRTNLDHKFSKRFSATLSSTFSRLKTERKDSGGGSRGTSLIGSAIAAPPILTPYNEDGSYRVLPTAYSFIAPDIINPLNFINEQSTAIKANVSLINAALIYNPIDKLTIKIAGGVENRDGRTDSYTTRKFYNSSGSASVSADQFISLLNENTISYTNTFNDKHNISVVGGFTYQDFITTSLSGSGTGFLSDAFETHELSAASTAGIPGSAYTKSVLLSYLGRANYSFNSKYLLTVSFRADGSSKFSKGNKWGYFPSAALAWRVSNEDFLKDNKYISNLKLRTSWGATGSQAIDAYVTLNRLTSGKIIFSDALYNTFSPSTNLPGDLKWESTEQLDFGADLGLLNNRISITADYYIKNTKDLLNTVVLPSSLGYTTTIKNVGKIQNKGFDFGVDAQIFTGALKWDLNANISINRNKVVKLNDGLDILGGFVGVLAIQDNINILREGQPIGRFFGYKEDGYTEKGYIKYKDLNNDGQITPADKTYIGDPNPDFIYGFGSNLSYKNFEFNVFLQGTYGNDLFNVSEVSYAADYGFGLNMTKDVYYNHWTPTNTNAKYPIISRSSSVKASDRFIEDGSYIRLKNIQLGYNFPVRKLGLGWFNSLQIYVSGQNLLTFTKYSGWDPEVNSAGGANSTVLGVDNNSYPNSKSFTCGIRARF